MLKYAILQNECFYFWNLRYLKMLILHFYYLYNAVLVFVAIVLNKTAKLTVYE